MNIMNVVGKLKVSCLKDIGIYFMKNEKVTKKIILTRIRSRYNTVLE